MYLLLFYFISVFIMRFTHEPLARILRATSIPRYVFNKWIECHYIKVGGFTISRPNRTGWREAQFGRNAGSENPIVDFQHTVNGDRLKDKKKNRCVESEKNSRCTE